MLDKGVVALLPELQAARRELTEVLSVITKIHAERVDQRTKRTHQAVERSLESGNRIETTLGLLELMTDCHTLRQESDAVVYDRLTPYLEALDRVITAAAAQLGLPPTLNARLPERKRRRTIEDSVTVDRPSMQASVLSILRDPQRAGVGESLSAAEHRLLGTVIPESALLPDVAAMHDVYHPNVCLYDTTGDREWKHSPGVHVGFQASTMLAEFALHRGQMRRFTFVHLLPRMGFAAADMNHYLTYIDDSFYRRVCTDTRVGFLAECYSPRVRVFRGQQWTALWDLFLVHREDWVSRQRTAVVIEALLAELRGTCAVQLVPNTVLGALHRRFACGMQPYDSWSMMDELADLEAAFLSGARKLANGILSPTLDGMRCTVRAWPVCLRRLAVHHVQGLMLDLRILPRTPQIAESATRRSNMCAADVAEWLWSLLPDRDTEEDSLAQLRLRIAGHMTDHVGLATTLTSWTTELDEVVLQECVTQRFGPVTEEHQKKMTQHLENLETLVRAAAAHGPSRWTEGERTRLGYRPTDVLAAVQEDAACMCPEEYEAATMRRLHAVMTDPLLGTPDRNVGLTTGDSQLRPHTLYPAAN